MKIIWGVLAIFLCLVGAAFAQQKPNADQIVAKMTKELKLYPDQAAAVRPIITNTLAQREQLMKKMQVEIASIHSQMEQLKEDENKKLSKILTKDQMTLLNFIKSHKHVRHNANGSASLGSKSVNNTTSQ